MVHSAKALFGLIKLLDTLNYSLRQIIRSIYKPKYIPGQYQARMSKCSYPHRSAQKQSAEVTRKLFLDKSNHTKQPISRLHCSGQQGFRYFTTFPYVVLQSKHFVQTPPSLPLDATCNYKGCQPKHKFHIIHISHYNRVLPRLPVFCIV